MKPFFAHRSSITAPPRPIGATHSLWAPAASALILGFTGYASGTLVMHLLGPSIDSAILGGVAFEGCMGLTLISIGLIAPAREDALPRSGKTPTAGPATAYGSTGCTRQHSSIGAESNTATSTTSLPQAAEGEARGIMEQFYALRETVLEELGLTSQERAVAIELMTGGTYREASRSLYLAESTVKFHAKSVYRKAHAHSRAEFARAVFLSMEQKSERMKTLPHSRKSQALQQSTL